MNYMAWVGTAAYLFAAALWLSATVDPLPDVEAASRMLLYAAIAAAAGMVCTASWLFGKTKGRTKW